MALRPLSLCRLAFLAAAPIASTGLLAQCATSLQSLEPPVGINGALRASILWDRDGSGPAPIELVIGGDFTRIGGARIARIARFDPVLGWQPLGLGVSGPVRSFAIDGAGRLVVGGSFTMAGGIPAPGIARFDGTQWSALATPPPVPGGVTALAPEGDTRMNYVSGNRLGYFDGTAVYGVVMTVGGVPGDVHDVARLSNGDLLVGGRFDAANGTPVANLARFAIATSTWSTFGGGVNGTVRKLVMLDNDRFYVFGDGLTVAGQPSGNVARWDGASWTTFPWPQLQNTYLLGGCVANDGGPVVHSVSGIRRFVNGAWQVVPPVVANMSLLTHARQLVDNSFLVGSETSNGLAPAYGYRIVTGGTVPLADGLNGSITCAAELADGDILVHAQTGKQGAIIGGLLLPGRFARRSDNGWIAEPTGAPPLTATNALAQVTAILPQPDGGFVATGNFTTVGGQAIAGIARFDGASWHGMGAGAPTVVGHAIRTSDGAIVTQSPGYRIDRYQDGVWTTLDPGNPINTASGRLAAGRDGAFVATTPGVGGTAIVRWTGSAFVALGVVNDQQVFDVAELRDGSVVVAGAVSVLRLTSAGFAPIAGANASSFRKLVAMPDGGFAVSCYQSVPGTSIVPATLRFDGSQWTPIVSGGMAEPYGLANGDLLLVGSHDIDADTIAAVSRRMNSCPAGATALAAGCAGGEATLASDAPWLGQTLRLQASGLPAAAFAIAVGGTQSANLPLASVFATALPGCALLVQPDVTSAQLAVAGKAQLALAIPNTAALVGATFRQQFVSFALDPSLAIGATNALQLAVGSY